MDNIYTELGIPNIFTSYQLICEKPQEYIYALRTYIQKADKTHTSTLTLGEKNLDTVLQSLLSPP